MTGTVPRTRLFLIRHAPVPEAGKVIYGKLDVACDCSDTAAFETLVRRLPPEPVPVVSGLTRTWETWRALVRAGYPDLAPVVEPALEEQHFGDWEGDNWTALKERGDPHVDAFWREPFTNRPPNGESFADMLKRTAAATERLIAQYAGRDLVIVGHAGSIKGALAAALKIPAQQALALFIGNLSLTRMIHYDGEWRGQWRVELIGLPATEPGPPPLD